MKIRHERPAAELAYKVRAPLRLMLSSGEEIPVETWSLAEITLPEPLDILPSKGTLVVPFQGVDISFPVSFTPSDRENTLRFSGLDGRQRETLAVFYRSILSGKMATTEQVITSLDTPVDLIPMGETEEEKAEATANKKPRALRALWNLTFYMVLAAVVFSLLGSQIWARLTSIRVDQARVTAELVQVAVPDGAYVDTVLVAIGDRVAQGDTLVRLSSPDHRSRLEDLRETLRRVEVLRDKAEADLTRHLARTPDARARHLARYQAALSARRVRDFLGGYNMDDVQFALALLQAFDDGLILEPGDFNALRAQFTERRDALEAEHATLKRRLSAEKSAGAAADLVASVDGIVADLPVFENQFVTRGNIGAVIDAIGPRRIVGWLDERMATQVFLGMEARLRYNALGKTQTLGGTVTDIRAGVDPERPGTFGLRVEVTPAFASPEKNRAALRPDAPAQVTLLRPLSRWPFRKPQDARP